MALPRKSSYLMGGTFDSVAPTLNDGDLNPLELDSSGNLKVNVVAGGGSGSNAAAGPTGSAVPADADYQGVNIGGILTGVTGLALGATTKAPTVAIVDSSGNQITSFGGGTQYATGTAVPTPTGTAALGWDGTDVRVLSTDASGQLKVLVENSVTVGGTVNVSGSIVGITGAVDVSDRAARLVGIVYGSQSQQLKQTATNFNLQVELATGGTLYDARQIRALTSADVVTVDQGTSPWVVSWSSAQHVIVDSGSINVVQTTSPWVTQDNSDYADNAASGAAPIGSLAMGWDSTNSKIRALKVDPTQALRVGGTAAVGAAAGTGTPVRVAGVDGSGNVRDLPVGQITFTAPSNAVLVGGEDLVSNVIQPIPLNSGGTAVQVVRQITDADGLNNSPAGLATGTVNLPLAVYGHVFNGTTWDRAYSGGATGMTGVAGAAATGTTKSGNPVQVGGVFNLTQPTVVSGQIVEAQSTSRGALIIGTGVDAVQVGGSSAGILQSLNVDTTGELRLAGQGGGADLLNSLLLEVRALKYAVIEMANSSRLNPRDFIASNFSDDEIDS